MKADDHTARFSVGVVRITAQVLNSGLNHDGKKTLNAAGRSRIRWLVGDDCALPPNQLLELDPPARTMVLAAGSGQQRVMEFLRRFHDRIILRNTACTLAQPAVPHVCRVISR